MYCNFKGVHFLQRLPWNGFSLTIDNVEMWKPYDKQNLNNILIYIYCVAYIHLTEKCKNDYICYENQLHCKKYLKRNNGCRHITMHLKI